jgi:hypothetical protein
MMLAGTTKVTAMPSAVEAGPAPVRSDEISAPARLAQAEPAPAPAPSPGPAVPRAPAAEPIGNVATLSGSATVNRNNASTPLRLRDDIYQNDVLQTAANSALGVTFNDATTFDLSAEARIAVDFFAYQDGGQQNGALFNVARGTVAFVAAAVAKTGDMRIATPTATLGIRGTTGLIEVPQGASATGANNVAIKLYPDPDGSIGQIDVTGRDGTRLGTLTEAASGFAIRSGAGGRLAALPLLISPQQALRDQGIVRAVRAAQSIGRQIVNQRRIQRLQYPARNNPAANPARRPSPQRPNSPPRQPGSNRPGQQAKPPQAAGLPRPPHAPGLGRDGLQNKPALQKPRPGVPKPKGKQEKDKR